MLDNVGKRYIWEDNLTVDAPHSADDRVVRICDSTSLLNRSHNSSSKRPWGTIRTPCTYLAPLRFITGVLRSKMQNDDDSTFILYGFVGFWNIYSVLLHLASDRIFVWLFVHFKIQTLCSSGCYKSNFLSIKWIFLKINSKIQEVSLFLLSISDIQKFRFWLIKRNTIHLPYYFYLNFLDNLWTFGTVWYSSGDA